MARLRAAAVVVGILLTGLLTMPAMAGVETGTIAILSGSATVGNSIGGGPIPQNGECVPTGKGLQYPTRHVGFKNKDKFGLNQMNKEFYYRLSMPSEGAVAPLSVVITDTNDPENSGTYIGTMNVCGIIGPGPTGIGAACGSSSGYNGQGKLDVTSVVTGQRRIFDLQKVTWPPTATGALLVFGYITRVNAAKNRKFSAKGILNAKMNVVPDVSKGQSCNNPKTAPKAGGATRFLISGTAAATAWGKPLGGKDREPKLRKET